MKDLPEYEEPTNDGAEFIVRLINEDAFGEDLELETVLKTLRNTAFNANAQFEDKKQPVTGHVLFRVKNAAEKMFYYGGLFEVNLEAKVIRFRHKATYTKRDYIKAFNKKKKDIEEQEKRKRLAEQKSGK